MEETKQQPLALRVCAELAGSFLLCFAIYAFSTWGSAVYGINIVFFALATGLAYAAVTAIFSRVSGGQLNPAITVASVLVSKTKILDGILYVTAQVIGAIAAGFAVVKLLPTSEQVAAKVWLTPAVNGFENGSVSYSLHSLLSTTAHYYLACRTKFYNCRFDPLAYCPLIWIGQLCRMLLLCRITDRNLPNILYQFRIVHRFRQ